MSSIRPAAVAGAFYPGDAGALAAEVAAYLADVAPRAASLPPKALIAPHAGYMYSGPVAASVYARLAPLRGKVTRVLLAGPAHRVHVTGAAIPDATAFESPLGAVTLDRALLQRLAALPFVEVNARAHAHEHSLEVQVPFLQSVLDRFTLAPVVVGGATPAQMAELLEAAWGGPETLVVVSSDLSHYHAYAVAQAIDRHTTERILNLDATLEPEEACGATPINGLLEVARRRGLAPELIDLRNSGDTAGTRERVVGYAAFAFHER